MRCTAVFSMIKMLKILVEEPKLTDLIHSAIQYCFNIFYQRSKFLFGNAHKILHFQICSTPKFYMRTILFWSFGKLYGKSLKKCRTIEQVCGFPRLTEWTSNLVICSTMYARSLNVLAIFNKQSPLKFFFESRGGPKLGFWTKKMRH